MSVNHSGGRAVEWRRDGILEIGRTVGYNRHSTLQNDHPRGTTLLFNTWTFFAFALVVFPLYYKASFRWQNRLLLAASYVFYGAWDYRFLSLILFSTVVDYIVGRRIATTEVASARRRLLLVSCVVNLGLLGVFKYFNFFADGFQSMLGMAGIHTSPVSLSIVLPVGISFYTFQTMSYTIDIYRRKLEPVRNFTDFALFVAYFPQLVAGPIERAKNLLPQIVSPRTVCRRQIIEGAWLIGWGLFKKAIIADNIAIFVDEAFFPGNHWASGSLCLFAIYGFAIQIYCDFSGYSDVARGLGKLMGIEIMQNFNLPYMATSPQEFWRRWHISLSTWLRDYLYVSLGGNRHGRWMTYRNLMLTMVLGGLWHGAAWTFVLWGVYQGALLAVHRYLFVDLGLAGPGGKAGRWISRLVMFHLTCFGWLIFRAGSVAQIGSFLRRIFTSFILDLNEARTVFAVLFFGGILALVEMWIRNVDDPRVRPGWNGPIGAAAATILLIVALIFWPPQIKEFIYFQF